MAFVDDKEIRRIIAENENLMANNRALKTSLDECMSSSEFLVKVLRKNGIMQDISPSRKEYSRLKKQLGENRQTVMAEHPGQPHNNREMHIYGYFEHELRVLIDENTKYLRRAHDAEIAAKQTITLKQRNEELETKLKNISYHSGTRNRLEADKAALVAENAKLRATHQSLEQTQLELTECRAQLKSKTRLVDQKQDAWNDSRETIEKLKLAYEKLYAQKNPSENPPLTKRSTSVEQRLKRELDTCKTQNKTLSDKLAANTNKCDKLKEEALTKLTDMTQRIEALNRELSKFRMNRNLEQLMVENEEQKNLIQYMEKELAQPRKQPAPKTHSASLTRLQGKLSALKAENSKLSAENAGYEQASQMSLTNMATLREKCAETQESMLKTLTGLQEENKALQAKNTTLTADLKQCSENKTHSGTRTRLERELTESRGLLAASQKELEALKKRLQEENKALQAKNETLTADLTAKIEKKTHSNTKNRLVGELTRLREALDASQKELQDLKQGVDASNAMKSEKPSFFTTLFRQKPKNQKKEPAQTLEEQKEISLVRKRVFGNGVINTPAKSPFMNRLTRMFRANKDENDKAVLRRRYREARRDPDKWKEFKKSLGQES